MNSLKDMEKNLRSIAKRYRTVRFSTGLAVLFLMLGINAFAEEAVTEAKAMTRPEIGQSLEGMAGSFERLRAENNKLLSGAKLELIQLMEQGNQVVKSPWSSWQFGLNYVYANGGGHYKGRGDKSEKYPYEGIFTRSEDPFERYTAPNSKSYTKLPKSKDPYSASSNRREGLEASYGIASTKKVDEPIIGFEINAGINPKTITKEPLTISIVKPKKIDPPKAISFSPIKPEIPTINTASIDIKDFSLVPLWNLDYPAGSQYAYKPGNSKIIRPGVHYDYKTDYGHNGGIAATYNRTHDFIDNEVLKTSDGECYQGQAGYTNRNENRDYTFGAIFEFWSGEYVIEGLTLEVDEAKRKDGSVVKGARAISTDGSDNIKVQNKSNIKLSADQAVGFATDEGPDGENKIRSLINEQEGLIYGTGTQNAAFILVKEQNNPKATHKHINRGSIIMDGDESYAFTFSKTDGVDPDVYITHNVNEGEIVMAGKNSYGFALGKSRKYKVAASHINNSQNGTISMLGDESIAIVTQSDMAYANNEGVINIAGNSSYGMYTESSTTMENKGIINIDDYKKNFTSNNAGGKWLNNKEYSASNAEKSIGIASGKASSTITNKGEINLKTGKNNIGIYTKIGKVVNDKEVNVTAGENIGIYVTGTGLGQNAAGAKVTVNSNGSMGLVSSGTATITNEGEVHVTGGNNSSNTRGSIGMSVGNGSTIDSKLGKATIDVKEDKSIGVYSDGTLKLGESTITAKEGAVNYFADNNGNIEIDTGKTSKATTGQKSLLFYNGQNGTGKIILEGNLEATVEGGTDASNRGTAFYYVAPGATYGTFGKTQIQSYFDNTFGTGTSTLDHLTLTMKPGSRLFVASNVKMDLSNASADNVMQGITHAPTITGSDYKTFMLYLSKLVIDQASNLDDASDAYNQLEISNSSIENTNAMTGSKNKQVAMAQENGTDPSTSQGYRADKVTLTNKANGTITLTGEESTGIYAKRGYIENEGTINMGKKSTGIYLREDNQTAVGGTAGFVSNKGTINLGENSTGIYYSNELSSGANPGVALLGGVGNDGKIQSSEDNVVGMIFDSPNNYKKFENETHGEIILNGQKSTGMFATGAGNYSAVNSGVITLAASSSIGTPNVGIYTDQSQIKLENRGTIRGGDRTVGMYGSEITLTGTSDISVGKDGTAIYSAGGDVTTGGTLTVGAKEKEGAVGLFYNGTGGTITNDADSINIGDGSFGVVINKGGNTYTDTKTSTVTLGDDVVYLYSGDKATNITTSRNLTATAGKNYGIYAAGTVTNSGNMDFGSGVGNVGIYLTSGTASNTGAITIGGSDLNAVDKDGKPKPLYGIGMATTGGYITNNVGGIIKVLGENSIGMYATGAGHKAENKGDIILSASNTTGIYADDGAEAINSGNITTSGTGLSKVVGVYLGKNSTLTNTGTIDINAADGVGVYLKGGVVNNTGTIRVNGSTDEKKTQKTFTTPATGKEVGGVKIVAPAGADKATIEVNGVPVKPEIIATTKENFKPISSSSIGMYINTSGTVYTNPIKGLGYLTDEADLIIGAEAAQNTTSKYISINDANILDPYNKSMMNNPQVTKWNIYSGALNWMATATLNKADGTMKNIYMTKIPYTEWAGKKVTPVDKKDTYNFLDGLEQRYGVSALGSRENQLFQKLNGIGNNEEILFYQATDEMMGHQYANVQQRIQATGSILDQEFKYLKKEWDTKSKDSNKLKAFGMRGEYKTDTAGIIDYTSHAEGFAYLHENETVQLGNTTGWYTGLVHNEFKFKDIGKSKEEMLQAKLGVFKSTAFDHNNSLNWTISGEMFVGRNRMNRKYLVVDDIFHAKSRYWTYGLALTNEVSKSFRTSESTFVKPYGELKLEYGRFQKIKEKDGEVRLEVKANDYYSVKPEVGMEAGYKHELANRKTFTARLGVAYSNELGQVANGKNKARVAYTNAGWFNIRGEKEDRRGNLSTDLHLGLDNEAYGVTANIGYDTKGQNVRGGLGLRVIF